MGWVGLGGIGIMEFRDSKIGELVVGFGLLSIGWTITFFCFELVNSDHGSESGDNWLLRRNEGYENNAYGT